MRLSLVSLLVPDYDAGLAFLTAIGFQIIDDSDQGGGKRWVVVRPPGGGSDLLLARGVGSQQAAIGNQTGGRVAFFLTSMDFAADAKLIRAAGGTFEEVPRNEPYGTVAVFRDPFGNRWDLIEPVT
jgi:catechol 2,3-dioxygenase-like lactoylglutathione lyase family enzyme